MNELNLIEEIQKYAYENYDVDGWDYLIECYDVVDIAQDIKDNNLQTLSDCVKFYQPIFSYQNELRGEW